MLQDSGSLFVTARVAASTPPPRPRPLASRASGDPQDRHPRSGTLDVQTPPVTARSSTVPEGLSVDDIQDCSRSLSALSEVLGGDPTVLEAAQPVGSVYLTTLLLALSPEQSHGEDHGSRWCCRGGRRRDRR